MSSQDKEDYLLSEFITMALPEEALVQHEQDEVEDYLSYFISHSSEPVKSDKEEDLNSEARGVEILSSRFISGYASLDYTSPIGLVRVTTTHISTMGMPFMALNTSLICYTLSGGGEVTVADKVLRCRKYDCVCVDSSKRCNFRAYPGQPWECVFIRVGGKLVSELFSNVSERLAETGALFLTFGAGARFRSLLWDLLSARTEANPSSESLYNHLLLSIFIEPDIAVSLAAAKPTIIPDLVLGIQNYLEINYSTDISLDSLAKTFNISKFHMSREFKKYIGKSPIDYLIDVRINRAKSLLTDSGRPVSDICQLVGIPNPNHFLYLFKEREGITPTAFRKFKL